MSLPANPFDKAVKDFARLSNQLEVLSKAAGIGNNKFRKAYGEIINALTAKKKVEDVLYTSVHVRALALSLVTPEGKKNVSFTPRLLNKITQVVKKPSSLVIESFYQHFLAEYDQLADLETMAYWLLDAKRSRGNEDKFDAKILSAKGPKWLAQSAIEKNIDFDHLILDMKLERYASGRYLTVAKGIYYIEQLKVIPLGQDHSLLEEVQKAVVFNSRYDSESLLGHQIISILISRSIGTHISECWMNVILAIGGDPRVPSSNPRYIKWWKVLEPNLIQAVRGWLSKLDLKLFLEALEDYSYSSSNDELQRMYPSRKSFLEGMFDAGIILNTRLYLSKDAARYLKRNYDPMHLPNFSTVKDGDKSIIYVQMKGAHMVEGSHSCYLWLYPYLDPSVCVFNYNIDSPTYYQLTQGINDQMSELSSGAVAKITHSPTNYAWQRKALTALRRLGINLTPKDVLSSEDYIDFKQSYGVRGWS